MTRRSRFLSARAQSQGDHLVAPLEGRLAPVRRLAEIGPRHDVVDGVRAHQGEPARRRVAHDPVGEVVVFQNPAPRRAAEPALKLGPSGLLGEVVDEAVDILGVQDVSRRHGSCFLSAGPLGGLVGQVTVAARNASSQAWVWS